MTTAEKITTIETLYGEKIYNDEGTDITDTVVGAFLDIATQKAFARIYPYGTGEESIPEKFDLDICELTVRLLARRGGEGEIQHSENGVARIYSTVNDEDIMARFTPYGKVV